MNDALTCLESTRARLLVRKVRPTLSHVDFLGVDVPPIRIDVRDTTDVPCWWDCTYYRGTLPARAVGGATPPLRVSIGDRPIQYLELGRLEDAWLVKEAAERGERIAVFGLSRSLNVIGVASADAVVAVAVRAALIAGIKAAGLPIWAEADDWYPALGLETFRRIVMRRSPSSPPPSERDIAKAHARQRDSIEVGLLRAFAAASGVVVATEPLAVCARRVNAVVRVIPNCVDPDEMAHTVRRDGGEPFRIGMTGSPLKFEEDLPWALPGLIACARRPGTELHFFGGRPADAKQPTPHSGEHGRGVICGAPYHFRAFGDLLRYQREAGILDVAALPLRRDAAFNHFKSGQKWMEMALHGTATVVQRLAPYDLAEDNETCLKAETPEEWKEQLLRLAGDARLRRRIGDAAREEVLTKHTLAARRPLWEALPMNSVTT